MRGLAIETSSLVGSVALFELKPNGLSILGDRNWQREQSHSELVTPAIENLLAAQGLKPQDLQMIAVSVGPGSFTGVRVGINVARAMAYSLNLPIFTFNSHRILVEQARQKTDLPIVTMTNAFKQMVFVAKYSHSADQELDEIEAPHALSLEQLRESLLSPVLCLGDGPEVYSLTESLGDLLKIDPQFSIYPSAKDLCRLCAKISTNVVPLPWREVKPLYIRASAAEENLESLRKSKK